MAAITDDCKASYRLRACWFDDIADFDDAERADLMGALIDYHFGAEHEFTTRAATIAWRNISRTWAKDESHDSGLRDVRAAAGRRGALARWQSPQDAQNGGFSGVEDDDAGDDIPDAEYPAEDNFDGVDGDSGDCDNNVVSAAAENGKNSKSMAKNGKRIFCHKPPMAKNGYKDISKKIKNTPLSPPVGKNGKNQKGDAKDCGGITPPQEDAPISDASESSGISPATDGETHNGFAAEDSPQDSAQSDAGLDAPARSDNTGDGIPPSPGQPPKSRRSRGGNVADFVPPTLKAWQAHAEHIGWKASNRAKTLAEIAAAFYYWQKLGWRTGNRPIVDWRAACADSKIRADSKAGRLPASIIDDVVDSSVAPQFWKLELANLRHANLDDFAKLRWRDYADGADKNEVRDVVARCLVYPENEKFLK